MGISSDGILAFGFTLNDDEEGKPEFLGDYDDLAEFLGAQAGIPDDDYEKMWEHEKPCPAELVSYCSHEYTMYLLAVRGTQMLANRGEAVDIPASHLAVSSERISAFREWCASNGVLFKEPQWLLCSMYG